MNKDVRVPRSAWMHESGPSVNSIASSRRDLDNLFQTLSTTDFHVGVPITVATAIHGLSRHLYILYFVHVIVRFSKGSGLVYKQNLVFEMSSNNRFALYLEFRLEHLLI